MNKDFIVKNGLQVASNVYIGGEVSNVTAINFYAEHNNDQPSEGHLCWNSEDGTLNLGLTGGNVVLQTGQETLAYVKNTTANTILNGTTVAHTSAQDGRLIVQPFIADGTFLPEEFLGVATENIAPSSLGYVNTFGYVRDFDTSSFNVGAILYASADTPGGLTSETPISPNVKVVVGSVVSSGASGSIFVDRVSTPLASDVTYNNATSNLVATNLQAAVDELQFSKASVDLLSSSITVYPTTAASNVANYFSMVTDTDDSDYDDPAANVATGAITVDNQLIANVIADAGIFVGNPGAINITTIGNIAKTSGNQNQFAEFYFVLYKRDESGTETAIGTSSTTGSVNPDALNQFSQFSATALLNTTAFTSTDRLVVKYYGNVTGNPGAEYAFQFGGVSPVRTLLPVPVSVIPSGAASSILVDTSTFNGVLSGADSTLQTALETLDDHSHSTDEVSEGSNLYYTVSRANTAIDARVTKTYVDALNVDADTLDNQNSSYYLDWANTTNKPDPNIEVVLTGDVTGSSNVTLTDLSNGSLTITTTVADDSHNHTISNVDGLQASLDGKVVNTRTITAGAGLTGGGDLTTNRTISHADTSTQASVNNSNGTVIQDVTLDTYGHVTSLASKTLTTTDISEGSNLYYTVSRANTAIDTRVTKTYVDALNVDADLLDGQQGSYYLDWTNTTNKPDPTLTVNGDASGSATFTNLGNATLTLTIADDSHSHTIVNIDGLQTSLDSKANVSTVLTAGAGLTGGGSLATDRTFTIGAGAGITVNTSNIAVDTSVIATRAYVDSEVSNLVASAPETLDTLNELAAALGDDPNFATTVSTQIGTKANSSVTVSAGAGLTGGGRLNHKPHY
jgi:hypothetical protein